jgi:hypothetical protein
MKKLVALSALAALFTVGTAHAFTAPFPSKAQQKVVTAQIQKNVQRTSWYKGLVGAGLKPKLTVSYGKGQTPPGFIGSGFPVATAIVSAGKSIYKGVGGLQPQKERQFTVREGVSGKFSASGGKWQQLMTMTAGK